MQPPKIIDTPDCVQFILDFLVLFNAGLYGRKKAMSSAVPRHIAYKVCNINLLHTLHPASRG